MNDPKSKFDRSINRKMKAQKRIQDNAENNDKVIRISLLFLPLSVLMFILILGLLIWGNIEVWGAIF